MTYFEQSEQTHPLALNLFDAPDEPPVAAQQSAQASGDNARAGASPSQRQEMQAQAPLSAEAILGLAQSAREALAQIQTLEALEAFRLNYLGRKGQLTLLKRGLKDVADEARGPLGQQLNALSDDLTEQAVARQQQLQADAMAQTLASEQIDVTMPAVGMLQGKAHPLTQITLQISQIFTAMGYQVLDDNQCPEVETDYYNFEALNFAADHPARDMQDTFYTDVAPQVLLRSQTSNAQIRYMEQQVQEGKQPPFKILAPGRVYRNEAVNSRKNVLFHQIEGLVVAPNIRFSDLKGTLAQFIQAFFGEAKPTRFRASYFPFTEPSAEVDVFWDRYGWLEILGCGMVHPNVLKAVGLNPEQYSGFAFGLGVERLAMLKLGTPDIRLFYQNDIRLLDACP
ncbi:MAG: phenylalanine--tRNA ligase subunit alpha [Vampirovibrionales bacterium]|nr:phenylalanine--tRNA ligase subunit alpha [Vampirovibrionales bacterium]